ncbi:DUF6119 family protein [Lentzea sp. NPDC051838]|uniref:DUF6119 family protein n=1 Tax=Lentzea sp. NPDC051838 TaxID=3154849 RepID=UPI003432CFB5
MKIAATPAGGRIADETAWAPHPRQVTDLGFVSSATTPFTVILIQIDENWAMAACRKADARHLLDEGVRLPFGIRRLDPVKLRPLNSNSLDTTSRSKQTSFPRGHSLSGFGLEPAGELVTGLAGATSLEGLNCYSAAEASVTPRAQTSDLTVVLDVRVLATSKGVRHLRLRRAS